MSNGSGANLPPFPSSYRASGLLLHVTSLPSPYGIGDVGPAAIAWVDQLCDAGQLWWQALPLGPTGYGNSPYQVLSSFAGNGQVQLPSARPGTFMSAADFHWLRDLTKSSNRLRIVERRDQGSRRTIYRGASDQLNRWSSR